MYIVAGKEETKQLKREVDTFFFFTLKDAKIDPEEFTGRLQTELKSSPQPYLVPFLKVM